MSKTQVWISEQFEAERKAQELQMNLKEYQEKARDTRFEETKGLRTGYSALGLTGEAGEVADKVKKIIRGDFSLDNFDTQEEMLEALEAHKQEIVKELGDVLWYVAAVADDLDTSLDLVAAANLEKLASRKDRGELRGSGDNR